jgi:hypothetical protein
MVAIAYIASSETTYEDPTHVSNAVQTGLEASAMASSAWPYYVEQLFLAHR